jgi:tetratricopeptide (TPR) repeat protein
LLEYQTTSGHLTNSEYQDANLFTRFTDNFLKWIEETSHASSILYERTGRYYETYGDLAKALMFYQDVTGLLAQLHQDQPQPQPQHSDFKNSLAVSLYKLGDYYQKKKVTIPVQRTILNKPNNYCRS